MQRSQEIKDFIREHHALFWYSPEDKCETVSDELLVETILNYGTMAAVLQLFKVMGIKNVAKVFRVAIGRSERSAGNYYEVIRDYFTLFFNRYAY